MKFSAIVLRNINSALESVRFGTVVGALLSGGMTLDEIAILSYGEEQAVRTALDRMGKQYDGVFVICDDVLLSFAKEAVSEQIGRAIADGEWLTETEKCLFAVLPTGERGERIVSEQIVPAVERRRGKQYRRMVVCTVAAPRDKVLSAVAQVKALGGGLSVHTSDEYGAGKIEVVYDQTTPKTLADEAMRILSTELKEYVYSHEDESIAKRLYEALKLHRMKLSTAESFTGGGVGRAIVEIPGASKVFFEGLNTYANESKLRRLGVNVNTLSKYGAVSGEVAYEMAAGLLRAGGCDIAVATTGLAGPDADGTQKPVGLCYIAVGTAERVRVFQFRFSGTRKDVTEQATNLALFLTYKEING